MTDKKQPQLVQTFGRKRNSIAVATIRKSDKNGFIRVNGSPLELVEPRTLRLKAMEPLLLLGNDRFRGLDIRVKVRGGGGISQIYAIRQAISKGIVAFYQKFEDETKKREIKELLLQYDRTLLVADPRRCEPRKFGGIGARARRQKSYR